MKILLVAVSILISVSTYAQIFTKTGIRSVRLRNSGEVIHKNQVNGYYLFYNLERAKGGVNNFLLTVTDENLVEINSVTITRTTAFSVLEASYNGEIFAVIGYDTYKNMIEIIAFDNTLKQIASTTKLVRGLNMRNAYGTAANGNEPEQNFLVPVTGKGFLLYSVNEDQKAHFSVEFYDNNLKSVWNDQASKDSDLEIGFEAFQNSKAIGSLIEKRRRNRSKDIEYDLLVNNTATGKRLFKVPVLVDDYSVTVSDVRHDTLTGEFIVFGEYYSENAKEARDRSLGFMSVVYDSLGKQSRVKANSWQQMSQVTPLDEKGKFEGSNTSILLHNTIRTSDGQIFVIGEQYKKAASAGGIALNIAAAALGGGATTSVVQINIYGIVIFQFNPDFSIAKVHVFDKNKSVYQMPAGALESSPKVVSHFAKAIGAFDYRFSQMSEDNSRFSVTYVDYDRTQSAGKGFVVGSIVYTPEKTFVVDKFTVQRRPGDFVIFRAKPGYVAVTEYFRKEKKLETRLEKVNY